MFQRKDETNYALEGLESIVWDTKRLERLG